MVNKQYVRGTGQQMRGSIKSAAGRLSGDTRLKLQGYYDKAVGGIRRSIGTLRDRLRGK